MSLIMDALKRAQQLRLKESKGTPFFKNSPSKNSGNRTGLGKRWIVIGAILSSLVIVVFVFFRTLSTPLTSKPERAVALIQKKVPLPVVEKKPPEPLKGIAIPESTEGPKETLSPNAIEGPKDILSQSKGLQEAKAPLAIEPSIVKKKEEPPKKQVSAKKKVREVKLSTPRPKERNLSPVEQVKPSLPASLKEEALSKPTETEREEAKDRTITAEAIHHFNLAVSLSNQRETLRAIQAYQKAIELNPAYVEAYNNLGIIYQETGDLDRAFQVYQKATEINPQYEKAYNNLGILLLLKGRLEEATEAFQKALTINPNNVESLINLGVLFRKQGQSDKGIEFYQKALVINPLRGETHYNIGLLYEEMENVELAIDHYQKFIQLSSKTYPVLASKVQRRVSNLLKVINNKSK
jgi:tetratricopeptide (TPR) repeat protein